MLGLISLSLSLIILILGFIANRLRKRRMRNALGREVENHELTSLNCWMKVVENEDRTVPGS